MPVVPNNDNPWRVDETRSAIGDFKIYDRPKTEFGTEYVQKNLDAGVTAISKAADEYRADIDKTRVIDAVIQLDRERIKLKQDYEESRTGASALELRDGKSLEQEQDEKLQGIYQGLMGKLGNTRQKNLFSRLGGEVRIDHNRQVGAFKQKQYLAYKGSVYQSLQDNALEKIQSDDAETREAGMQDLDSLVPWLARASGKTEDEVRRTTMGGAHSVLISGMLDRGDAVGAKQHLESFKQWMTPEQIAKAKALIEGQEQDDEALGRAAEIVGQEKDHVKRLEIAEKEQSPDLRKKIVARVTALNAREKQEEAANRERAMNASVEFVRKGVMPPNSVLSGLDERDRWSIEKEVQAQQKRMIADAERRGRALGGEGSGRGGKISGETVTKIHSLALSDPEAFLNFNPAQNFGTLGQKGVEYVQKLQDAMKKGMQQQFSDAEKQFESFCAGEGNRLDAKKKTRAKAVALRNFTNAWFASGGNVTNAQLMGIIKDSVERGVEANSVFGWGEGFLGRSKKSDETYADAEWAKANHGAAQQRKYFTAEENTDARAQMRAGVTVNGKTRYWRGSIGPDQLYCYQIWSRGTHDYPDEWVADAKSLLQDFNARNPKRQVPVSRANIEKIILERRMTLNDDFLKFSGN